VTAEEQLELAKKQLLRVQEAWDPPEWDDLSFYGFYCLENAVTAAATHAKITLKKTHAAKADASRQLTRQHGLPDVEDLLKDLNDARKSEAYGDVVAPELDAEDVVSQIENYVEAVKAFLEKEAP
jgi:HEPN domain